MRFFATLIFLLCAFFSQAQFDYDIRKNPAEVIKDKYQVPVHFLNTEQLAWGKIESDCFDKPVEYGKWFSVKAKSGKIRITFNTSDKTGFLSRPTVYFGKVEEKSQGKRLTELKCEQFQDSKLSYVFEIGDLNAETEYFCLVSSGSKSQRFGLEVTEIFELKPSTELVKTEPKEIQSIVGRVRTSTGANKAGVVVTLLNGVMQKVSETQTSAQGTFRFERLPIAETYITRIEVEDAELMVDLFLQNAEGKTIAKATKIGSNLFGFGADKNGFSDLVLLSKKDWTLNVSSGKTGVSGRIVDAATFLFGKQDVKVGLYDMKKVLLKSTMTDVNGSFSFKDIDQGNYSVKVDGQSKEDYSEMVMVDDLNVPYSYSNSNMMGEDGFFKFEKLPADLVELARLEEKDANMPIKFSDFGGLEKGKAIVLKNIFFESGSDQLKTSSFSELDQLAKELESNQEIKIEISGHSDNVGNEATNKILSENRAKAVQRYLVKQGIKSERLKAVGFGSEKPLASNETEEGRKQNRRVEFVVLND